MAPALRLSLFAKLLSLRPQSDRGHRRLRRRDLHAVRETAVCGAWIETLEERMLLSATSAVAVPTFTAKAQAGATPAAATNASAPYTPAQIATAYGINQISFNGTSGNGAGQTIAIVDAYNDPSIIADANSFSSQFDLPQFNASGGPTLSVINQNGGTALPANAAKGTWDVEEALDVEWAHSIAPDANIVLVEASSNSFANLFTAVSTAANHAGVSVVSMSWAGGEFSSESQYDTFFKTPAGHQGVTFLASTGDDGTPAGYPAYSPNVVAVGGTSLTLLTDGTYVSESGWDDASGAGGGGISTVEPQPSFQSGKVNGVSSTQRTAPDVSMDADPNTGVYVLDSYDGGWFQVGGTSLAAPMWGGLIAIADQGRVLAGQSTLDGATQTLPTLYSLPSSDFHDVTSGSNGTYAATTGYDLATGLGSPVANLLVPALAGYSTTQPPGVTAPATASLTQNGSLTFSSANGNAITLTDSQAGANVDSLTLSVNQGTLTLASTNGLTFTAGANGSGSMTITGTLANLNAALNGLLYKPPASYTGSASLALLLANPNDSLSHSATIAVTVNAIPKPTITAPASASVTQNSPFTFSSSKNNGITITDAAAGTNPDSLTLSAIDGTLALSSTAGLSITAGSNGSSSLTVSGTMASLNSALNGVTYTPNAGYVGSDTVNMSVTDPSDGLSSSSSIAVTVGAPVQPPSVTAPATATVRVNSSIAFSAANGNTISVADSNAGTSAERLTLTSTHGTLRLSTTSGITFVSGSNRSASMTISGTLAKLNAAISGLTFTPTSRFTGSASIGVSLNDVGDKLTGSATIAVTVSRTSGAARTAAVENGNDSGRNSQRASTDGTVIVVVGPSGEISFVQNDSNAKSATAPSILITTGNVAAASGQPGSAATAPETGSALAGSQSSAEDTTGDSSSMINQLLQWTGLAEALKSLGG